MGAGRPRAPCRVTAEERQRLEEWARRPKTAQGLAHHSRIVLECARGQSNTAVAGQLDITQQTVSKWRERFLERRSMVCSTNHGPEHPARSVTQQIERVVRITLESTRPTPRTGAPVCACQAQRSQSDHGQPHLGPLRCSRIGLRPSSFPKIHCWWKKCATL